MPKVSLSPARIGRRFAAGLARLYDKNVTITEALDILRSARSIPDPLNVQLACSFSPVHLKTLLSGHLQKRISGRRATLAEGTFGDLAGTIERSESENLAIAIEWQDLDPRLQYREDGAWGRLLRADLVDTARTMLARIEQAINRLPEHTNIAVSLTTLPLPPVFNPPTWQAGSLEILLRQELAGFASRIVQRKGLALVSEAWLSENSPASSRFDLKSDLLIGFPYTVAHADQLARALALALAPRQPLKGVITDLDNTLWSGLVGEVGADSVRWDPASRYYLHGLYQKLLASLADEGILIGIASKNDPKVVTEALKREDLLISPAQIFPIEVHWASKSESVSRILKTWNISAESVAFVDDTPLELAEVAATHAGITCLQFPAGDYNGVWQLIRNLRDLCGKGRLNEEDALRLESIRRGACFHEQQQQVEGDGFLSTVNATVTFDFDSSASSPRTLELINKTNQFNLNGVRLTEAEWQKKIRQPGAFAATVRYEDKFGALGTIAVLQGYGAGAKLVISTWVMSCRAFSRRIEHQSLKKLFERFRPSSIVAEFAPTAKNGPLQEFFASILGHTPKAPFEFTQDDFERACPALYHRVEETMGVTLNG